MNEQFEKKIIAKMCKAFEDLEVPFQDTIVVTISAQNRKEVERTAKRKLSARISNKINTMLKRQYKEWGFECKIDNIKIINEESPSDPDEDPLFTLQCNVTGTLIFPFLGTMKKAIKRELEDLGD